MSKGWGWLVVVGAIVVAGGCARYAEQSSAGDIALDTLATPSRALLQLHNGSTGDVRVFTVVAGQERYLGKVVRTRYKTFVLDLNAMPASDFGITIRRDADSTSKTFDVQRVRQGERINVVVRQNFGRSALSVRGS